MFPTPAFVEQIMQGLSRDLSLFIPELILCATIVGMLLARLVGRTKRIHLVPAAFMASAFVLVYALSMWDKVEGRGTAIFSGMLVADRFGVYVRIFLAAFLCLSLWLSMLTGIPDREDSADYSTMLLGGILGMMLMASANHLLMAFIAIEMASLPSYALSGFLKGRRQSSEAALKYVVYGASAGGAMLYGISLIAGHYGTGSLPAIVEAINTSKTGMSLPVVLGTFLVIVGLGFKLSAVPFHFWCPDVFEGAAAEVGAFLSVASKAAALALTTRFLFLMSGAGNSRDMVSENTISLLWAIFAAITATFGNIAALSQTNMKRLLAYSTIAHAGIMMMALTAIGAKAVGPLLFYIASYLLMNLGAFAVVAFMRNLTGSEEIKSYRGLIYRSPILAVTLSIFLLSLLGLPPLAGFAAKFQVFAILYETGKQVGSEGSEIFGWLYFGLLIVAALNSAISAGYYLRVVKVMILDAPEEGSTTLPIPILHSSFVAVLALALFAVGIFWNPLTKAATNSSEAFQKPIVPLEKNR
jgi:NADH-quinone oxidoreductase subunit N